MNTEQDFGRALREPALVASLPEPASGLRPSGDDPARGPLIETHPEFRDVIYRTLSAMDETNIPESYVPFSYIALRSELPIERVRAVVRFLASLGYAEFARGLMSDDGAMRGAGYALTDKGFRLLERVERINARDSDGPRMAETNEDSARGEAGPARAAEGGIAQVAQGEQP